MTPCQAWVSAIIAAQPFAFIRSDSTGRAMYCFLAGRRVVVVHAFIKKTPQTPEKELQVARKRVKEIQDA